MNTHGRFGEVGEVVDNTHGEVRMLSVALDDDGGRATLLPENWLVSSSTLLQNRDLDAAQERSLLGCLGCAREADGERVRPVPERHLPPGHAAPRRQLHAGDGVRPRAVRGDGADPQH